MGQTSANDLNANTKYPTLDGRIEATYAKRSTAQLKNSLYDSYIRAFRWATDRIGDAGVVAFVSNGGWVDGNTADGMRLSLADEYSHIYVYNLRGNARTAGDLRQKEAGKVFGSGSRNTVAIFIGIKDPSHHGPCQIRYRDIGDYLSRDQKLALVKDASIGSFDWEAIIPSADGDWINQRDETFRLWPVIGDKTSTTARVFATYSAGLKTSRDAWCYNFSATKLAANLLRSVDFYNTEVARIAALAPPVPNIDAVIDVDPTRFSWDRINKRQVTRGHMLAFNPSQVRAATYRPFMRQHAYFDPTQQLNNCTYQLPSMFPTSHHANMGIYQVGNGSAVPFSVIMLNSLPDLHVTGAGSGGQFFPRWTYQPVDGTATLDFTDTDEVVQRGFRRIDNITDGILALYRKTVGNHVAKGDIFYYVYGALHDPDYRTRYGADLKKTLPHIPTPAPAERFARVSDIGRQLSDLHVNYEAVEPFPLDIHFKTCTDPAHRETWRVDKMKWASKADRSAIIYNGVVTIAGIPDAAHDYMLGSRSALEWLIDRYQVKTDKASGIVNDPNDWCDEHKDATYIVDLIKKVTTVSVRTVELVAQLAY